MALPKLISIDKQPRAKSSAQMAKIDRLAVQSGIKLETMMELAGEQLATLSLTIYPKAKRVLILVGSGHNGGGGLVAARYLQKKKMKVSLFLVSKNLKDLTKKQLERATKAGVLISSNISPIHGFDLIVDTILGYSVVGKVKENVREVIELANGSNLPIIALDLPSGMDPNTGKPHGSMIKADATLALAAVKKGLLNPETREYTGTVYLADIGLNKFLNLV